MAKNKLSDLNDHLFAQLERLDDDKLTPEEVLKETNRAKAIVMVSSQILKTQGLVLNAMKLIKSGDLGSTEIPESFGIERKSLG